MLKKSLSRSFKSVLSFLFTLSLFVSFTANASTMHSLLHNPQDPVLGNPEGSVTIVEFFDYQCSHCVNMSSVISSIVRANPDVRVVFKEYPVRGALSSYLSRAALAANKQGKYYIFSHALLMSNRSLDEEEIMRIAKSVGLNIAKLKKDIHSSVVNKQIQENYQLARSLNINGTPVFFIAKSSANNINNLSFFFGEMSFNELQHAVQEAQGQ